MITRWRKIIAAMVVIALAVAAIVAAWFGFLATLARWPTLTVVICGSALGLFALFMAARGWVDAQEKDQP